MNKIYDYDSMRKLPSGIVSNSSQILVDDESVMKAQAKISMHPSNRNSKIHAEEYALQEARHYRQSRLPVEYSPINARQKVNLLLKRSLRYSYRQRCCQCCPTILCEIIFPVIILMILLLIRYGTNAVMRELNKNPNSIPRNFDHPMCSQNKTAPSLLSETLFKKCFKFPPSYERANWDLWGPNFINNKTNFIFQPMTNETKQLVELAKTHLNSLNCTNVNVWAETIHEGNDSHLLKDTDGNSVIIDLSAMSNIRTERNIDYNILVRASNTITSNKPVDTSFFSFYHPTLMGDRSNVTNSNGREGSELPEFIDVKMFIDMLLIGYQTNRVVEFELERRLMTCTSVRRDTIYESGGILVMVILILIDFVFLIPYLILLINLIREKNAKVKEILKVLGIEPVLNNLAHAIRTFVLFLVLIIILCIVYKLKLNPDAYFNSVSVLTLFIGYLINAIQLISFGIMNAQLFEKPVRAVLGTFFIYLLSIILHSYSIQWPVALQYILIFFSPYIAAHSLYQQAILHDLGMKDVSWFQPVYRSVPAFFSTVVIMCFSCVFYWVLSWYLEKVFPGEFGVPVEWNFLCKRDYWRKGKSSFHARSSSNRYESHAAARSMGKPVVHVKHLVKKFGPDKTAVNDVSFNLYENQITSLLGPNGSGKTTIFNCLIGMYQQTSGSIAIESENGTMFDTSTNMDMLRKSMGYCPQHDILFDLLTIREQLEFYATARGYDRDKEQIAEEMLALVNLRASSDLYCNSLSGGMKRRLSLACAFVGDTKIVLLDEPSSGLDPSNRRSLWDWLRSIKEGKTVLLTTHFMEESDALSDRIIIIADGRIKADGTSARLKEIYGSGYKLIVNKQNGYSGKDIQKELENYLPHISIESDIAGGDVVFRTNQLPNELFVEALRRLEMMKNHKRIKNYGVQNSTMDDVFIKLTRDINNDRESKSTTINIETIDKQCQRIFNNRHFLTGFQYHLNQFYGLIIKIIRVRYRRWALSLIVLLIPVIYQFLSHLISRSAGERGLFKMNIDSLNPQTIVYHTDPIMDKYFRASFNGAELEQASANLSEMNEIIWQKRKDRLYAYTDIYLGFNIPAPTGNRYRIEALSSNLISSHEIVSLASNTFYKHIFNDTSASIQTTLMYKEAGNFSAQPTVGGLLNVLSMASCFLKLIPTSLIMDVFIFYIIFFYSTVFLISERKDSFLSLLNISGLHPASYWIFSYCFDILLSTIWFCYLLAIYCLFDVAFNGVQSKKSLQNLIPLEFGEPRDLRVQFYPLTILIALPTLPFTYLLTKLFKIDILGSLTICFILIVCHLISIIIPIVMMIVKSIYTRNLLYWLFNAISPSINAQVIVSYILARKSKFCKMIEFLVQNGGGADDDDGLLFKPVGDDTIGWNGAILVLHVILLLLILIVIDSGVFQLSCSCLYTPNFDENELDEDVLSERNRILRLEANPSEDHEHVDHLTVNNLVKHYPMRDVLAVNHLTFGARRGEIFGLLGFNGAGKTTAFRIVVGDLMATQGTVYIDGQNVRRRMRSTRRLGYCPQEDCGMDFLTVRDSLYLLARIRGVRPSRIKLIVETISSLFLLDPFLNNFIHELSGGTKRRLHTAIAFIGPPLVIILDEPTTGVDPNARQQMQEIFLNAIKAKLTIVLTSHSMDECERVCNRLGIMVNGQLACLGTIQHLKSKFGQGYTVEIKVRSSGDDLSVTSIQNVQSFLLSQSDYHVEVKEAAHSTGLFQVSNCTPAQLFQLLEDNKHRLNIETYTISQTTLEQIFLSFGKRLSSNTSKKVV